MHPVVDIYMKVQVYKLQLYYHHTTILTSLLTNLVLIIYVN
jgi:hypothetical protein